MRLFLAALALAAAAPPPRVVLPAPSGDPRTVSAETDPLVAWAEARGEDGGFVAALATAVERSPMAREALAGTAESAGAVAEARGALRPRIDLDLTGQQALSRGFSHDPGNLIERSAPVRRADASITAEQTLFDFGAGARRLDAAHARDTAENARAEADANDAALNAASAWIGLHQARAERDLAAAALARDRAILGQVRERIASGLGAPVDTARVESVIGEAAARLADAQGAEDAARARFLEAFGTPPPAMLPRSPMPPDALLSLAQAIAAARAGPEARYAAARTEAARRELAAAHADLGPQFILSVSADKYSVTETVRDHDIRARLSLRQRLYGGGSGHARIDQAAARLEAARFVEQRIADETARDATIAWHDVETRDEAARALRSGYLAQRRARDAYAEQFRVSRGTLFEMLRVEGDLVQIASTYLRAQTAADFARWTLLARTGRLLAAIGIGGDRV